MFDATGTATMGRSAPSVWRYGSAHWTVLCSLACIGVAQTDEVDVDRQKVIHVISRWGAATPELRWLCDRCWVLPLLPGYVPMDNPNKEELEKAFAPIYTVRVRGDGRRCVEVKEDTAHTKLRSFMKEFGLCDADLEVKFLRGYMVEYRGSMAAAICTREEAEKILNEQVQLRNQQNLDDLDGWMQQRQQLGLVQEGKLALLALNMRKNFKISPLAIIHGGSGLQGVWELPEKTTTVLCKNDRLIFKAPDDQVEDDFEKHVNNLNDSAFLEKVVDCVKEASQVAEPGEPMPPQPSQPAPATEVLQEPQAPPQPNDAAEVPQGAPAEATHQASAAGAHMEDPNAGVQNRRRQVRRSRGKGGDRGGENEKKTADKSVQTRPDPKQSDGEPNDTQTTMPTADSDPGMHVDEVPNGMQNPMPTAHPGMHGEGVPNGMQNPMPTAHPGMHGEGVPNGMQNPMPTGPLSRMADVFVGAWYWYRVYW
eukprot:Skav221522  [mRNA]  locus=scaffold1248:159397:161897:- [translate_table: standard]